MVNKGITPIDPNSAVGALRLLLRDTDCIPLNPEEPGYGDYGVFSDDMLAAYVVQGSENITRAAGYAVQALAIEYSARGKSVKTDDLSIDLKSRGSDLLAVAKSFFEEATAAESTAADDFFQIVPFGGRAGRTVVHPEATPWPIR